MSRLVVRGIVRSGTLLAALLLSLGLPSGCKTDTVGPGKGKVVWIAQSISGRTFQTTTTNSLPGVSVTFLAGLDKDTLVPLATAVTNASGNYSILRSTQTGTPGDFWWFSVSGDGPVTVYLALWASKTGYEPVEVRQQLTRTPSSDPPTRLLENYQLMIDAALRPVSSGS